MKAGRLEGGNKVRNSWRTFVEGSEIKLPYASEKPIRYDNFKYVRW